MQVFLKHENAKVPCKKYNTDAGYDLSSCEEGVVDAFSSKLIDTGVAILLPDNCYGRIASRSGLAVKNNIEVGAGVVDYGYTNSIKVLLRNHSEIPFEYKVGDRIAQLIVTLFASPEILEVSADTWNTLSENRSRGLNGFGSTGV